MKRKRKDELVERGPIVEDEAITTINIPRYLNESKQEYSERIKLRIKLAAIALQKRRRIFSTKSFLRGPSNTTSAHNDVTRMYETLENKDFSFRDSLKSSSLPPLPARNGVQSNNISSFELEGGRAGDEDSGMFDDHFPGDDGFGDVHDPSGEGNRNSLGNNSEFGVGGIDQSVDKDGFALNINSGNQIFGEDDDGIDENASRRPSNRITQDIRSHVLESRMSLMMENLRNNATVSSSSDEDERPDGDPFEAEGRHAVVSFNDIVKGSTRSQAAKCFFDLLVLKTRNEIRIKQEAIPEGYGPIKVMLA